MLPLTSPASDWSVNKNMLPPFIWSDCLLYAHTWVTVVIRSVLVTSEWTITLRSHTLVSSYQPGVTTAGSSSTRVLSAAIEAIRWRCSPTCHVHAPRPGRIVLMEGTMNSAGCQKHLSVWRIIKPTSQRKWRFWTKVLHSNVKDSLFSYRRSGSTS